MSFRSSCLACVCLFTVAACTPPRPAPEPVATPGATALALESTSACLVDADCSRGRSCFQGSCVSECGDGRACAAGESCSRGRCVVSGGAPAAPNAAVQLQVTNRPVTRFFAAARQAERRSWKRLARRVLRWLTHETHDVVVTVDGEAHGHRAMQVLVLNSPYYAWALPVMPQASMEDGLLDVAVFPRMGRLALLRSLVAVWRMRPLAARPVRYHGARVEVTSDEALSVHADGKMAGTSPATFRCRRGALRVFA